MKVWVCKTFYAEGNPNEFSVAHIFNTKQKAIDWKAKHPGDSAEVEEMEVE